ncbi:hypothetical protein Tco_0789906 [Tanacetum coccineum]
MSDVSLRSFQSTSTLRKMQEWSEQLREVAIQVVDALEELESETTTSKSNVHDYPSKFKDQDIGYFKARLPVTITQIEKRMILPVVLADLQKVLETSIGFEYCIASSSGDKGGTYEFRTFGKINEGIVIEFGCSYHIGAIV